MKIDRKTIVILLIILVAGGLIGGAVYYYISRQSIYTDQAEISAPLIVLSPESFGPLQAIMVKPGDLVSANTVVAQINNQPIKTKVAGLIVDTQTNFGENYSPAQEVVTMIDLSQLRLVAHLDETNGLDQLLPGQRAVFTVDAFGGKQFTGTVDEISQTARQGDVVFNISGNRQTRQFDVKVKFDPEQYPELKNGMSAKVWIYKN